MGFLMECLLGRLEASRRLSLLACLWRRGGISVLGLDETNDGRGCGTGRKFAREIFCLQGGFSLKEKLCQWLP